MSYDFSLQDILEMAVQIEKNGAKFYRDAAANAADTSGKDMLESLAMMEEQHGKTFESFMADLSDAETESTVFDPNNEAVAYLKALADMRVFFKKDIDNTSLEEILKSAVQAEKDSIVFYLGMKELVPANRGKDKIDNIIKEEMSHIEILGRKLINIKK